MPLRCPRGWVELGCAGVEEGNLPTGDSPGKGIGQGSGNRK